MKKKRICAFMLLCLLCFTQYSFTYANDNENHMQLYVNSKALENGIGTVGRPFSNIADAQKYVRSLNKNQNITINIAEGEYFLNETLKFGLEDGANDGYKITYKGENMPTVSGGKIIDGWAKYDEKLYVADAKDFSYMLNLYVDNAAATLAKTNEKIKVIDLYNDPDTPEPNDGVIINAEDLGLYANANKMLASFSISWNHRIFPLEKIVNVGKDKLALVGRQPYTNCSFMALPFVPKIGLNFDVENSFELLDTQGEFYFNDQQKKVYYYPKDGQNMDNIKVYAPYLENIIDIRGESATEQVKNISFENIKFAHGAWNTPATQGSNNGQAQTQLSPHKTVDNQNVNPSFTPANIRLNYAKNIEFTGNVFFGFGGVAIGIYNGVDDTKIVGNAITDIAGGAISVGLPSQAFDENYEGTDVAYLKPCVASTSSTFWTADRVVDHDALNSGWAVGDPTGNQWWQVDLGKRYCISEIIMNGRIAENQPDTRKNLEIMASNDPDFASYRVIARLGSEAYAHEGEWRKTVKDPKKYRYVRIKSTVPGAYMFLADVRIISRDDGEKTLQKAPRNILINNNVIERTGTRYTGEPAIQGYFTENMEVSQNDIIDSAYSGVVSGWGWQFYNKKGTVAKNNKILNNFIHRSNNKTVDGGGIYTLGYQPNSVIKGNYIKEIPVYPAAIYPDEGSGNFQITNNVIENAPLSFFPWVATINDIHIKDNYSTTQSYVFSASNSTYENNKIFIRNNPTKEVKVLMDKAGVRDEYKPIKKYIQESKLLPMTEKSVYDAVKNYSTDGGHMSIYMLKPYENEGKFALKIANENNLISDKYKKYAKELQDIISVSEKERLTRGITVDRCVELKVALELAIDNFVNSGIFKNVNYKCDVQSENVGEDNTPIMKDKNFTIENVKNMDIESDFTYGSTSRIGYEDDDTLYMNNYVTYKKTRFLDSKISVNIKFNELEDWTWDNIAFNLQNPKQDFSGANNEAYLLCIKKSGLELQRFNKGTREMIFGEIPDFKGVGGPIIPCPDFKINEFNKITIETKNESKGEKIKVWVNDVLYIDYLDVSDNAIKSPGYVTFGATTQTMYLK